MYVIKSFYSYLLIEAGLPYTWTGQQPQATRFPEKLSGEMIAILFPHQDARMVRIRPRSIQ